MSDVGYSITRRGGKPATIVRVTGVTTDPKTGIRTPQTEVTNVIFAAKAPTPVRRVAAAREADTDIGETTIRLWSRDVPFTALKASDYIAMGGEQFQVVSSVISGTLIEATVRTINGTIPQQIINASASNSTSLDGSTTGGVT